MMLAPLRENRARQAVVSASTFPAPVEGWDASTALAAMRPLRAVQLKNWFPQPGYVEIRKGWQVHASGINNSSTSVESLMAWTGPASSKMFAAGGGKIYDATSSGAASSVVTSLTNNRWQWVNMTTSAGAYLVIANGADSVRHYNGTTWATPSITGVSSADLIHVNVHKKRLWFVQKDTTKAWYLATEAVAGAATSFELGSNFDRGGYLVAMGTWSLDAGIGPDDYAVFVSSRGQVAVYAGTDPASASTWALVGVFDLPEPIGRRCLMKYGSTPLLITVSGVLKLAMAISQGEASVTATALTDRIHPQLASDAASYKANFGWELCTYPLGTRLILNVPTSENISAKQRVMNTISGAWCEFDGHNANCWLLFAGTLYFGSNLGTVNRADYTSADGQTAITAVGQTSYQSLKAPGRLKRITAMQPLYLTDSQVGLAVGISTDFSETLRLSVPSSAASNLTQWGNSTWGGGEWASARGFTNDWTSTPALGRFVSVKFQAITGSAAASIAAGSWNSTTWSAYAADVLLQVNGFVVLAEPGGFI